MIRIRGDFNGLFGDLLCLSHENSCKDENGTLIHFAPGMQVTAFDEDVNAKGEHDELLAVGIVEPAPESLTCNGSKWVLKIDKNGVRHASQVIKD